MSHKYSEVRSLLHDVKSGLNVRIEESKTDLGVVNHRLQQVEKFKEEIPSAIFVPDYKEAIADMGDNLYKEMNNLKISTADQIAHINSDVRKVHVEARQWNELMDKVGRMSSRLEDLENRSRQQMDTEIEKRWHTLKLGGDLKSLSTYNNEDIISAENTNRSANSNPNTNNLEHFHKSDSKAPNNEIKIMNEYNEDSNTASKTSLKSPKMKNLEYSKISQKVSAKNALSSPRET